MAAGDIWKKLRGVTNTLFQLGLGGPNLKNSSGVVEVKNAADSAYANLRVNDLVLSDDDTNKLTLRTPANLAGDYFLEFPADDGSPAQVLTTDGSGVLSWATVNSGNDKMMTDTTALVFGSTSPVSMFTLPANARVDKIIAYVDTAFNGSSPTASVGVNGGSASKYMAAGEIDLKTVGSYEATPGLVPVGLTEALEITYSASSSSAGAARFEVHYSIPS